MQPIKIKSIDQINNNDVKDIVKTLNDDELIVIMSDNSFSKITRDYEGLIKEYKTGDIISRNPINTNWKPLWVGIRLYNCEVREIRQTFFTNELYITHYIENDIIKKY